MSLKKIIKKELFDKIKTQGFAFNHIRYQKSRIFKINTFLEEGLLGATHTPILKDKKVIKIEIYFEKIVLFESYKGNDTLLKEIYDWQNKINFVRFCISNIYDDYFYEMGKLNSLFNHRSDKKDLNILMASVYPEMKIRDYKEHKNGNITIFFGSGIFSFRVKKVLEYKKLTVDTLFFGSGSFKYQIGNKNNLAKKYRNIVKQNLNTQYVYDFNLNKYKNFYLKCN